MHVYEFIQDLAVIMLIAGFTSIVFHRLRQPVVLGYIIAGVIIGPYTPPFSLIENQDTINTLAELGVVFLMFSLGLEFNFQKISKVGIAASITAIAEIILMTWVGYEIGLFFHWKTIDAIFLGAILSISSTTIIVKALNELDMQRERFVQLIYGVLIFEDILAIAILAILSSIAVSGSVNFAETTITIAKLWLFIIVALVLGILLIPRLLSYVATFKSNEMFLITVLGLCFGACLLVIELHYSIALGAFIIGAIMAESKELKKIEEMIEPLRDMFSAIFFVSIGLLLNPSVLIKYALPIIVITIAVVLGKIIACSFGMFIVGKKGRTSLRVGMGMAQIGEFSFIIASLGISLNVTSHFLFPIAVAVSIITTFLTPYLIRFADPVSKWITSIVPKRISDVFGLYTEWLGQIRPSEENKKINAIIRKNLFQVVINLALVTAIFLCGSYFSNTFKMIPLNLLIGAGMLKTLIWGSLLVLSLPFLIAIYRKIKGLSMLLAELSLRRKKENRFTEPVRRIISEIIPAATIIAILFMIIALSASILPPKEAVIFVLILIIVLLIFLQRWFIKLHAKLQIALLNTMKKDEK